LDFPGARTIAVIERYRENKKTGTHSCELVAYITSLLDPSPDALLDLIRLHWTIEDRFFYPRDVTYNEDRQTMRLRHGPLNMALLRSFAISCSHLAGCASVPQAIILAARAFKKSFPKLNWLGNLEQL
jgi:predicted transposase YbfD/YdcC